MGKVKSEYWDKLMEDGAEVTKFGGFDMQVCVPGDWPDEAILEFAEDKNPCGTENGWVIREEGDEALAGMPAYNPCAQRHGYVHVMLDA